MDDKQFWDKIRESFDLSQSIVSNLRVFTDQDKRRLDFILQYHAGVDDKADKNFTPLEMSYGRLLYPMTPGSEKEGMYFQAAVTLGLEYPDVKSKINLPGGESSEVSRYGGQNVVPVIQHAIEKQECSHEFIIAWGDYHQAVGSIIYLIREESGEDNFKRGYLKGTRKIIEEEIVARWLNKPENLEKLKEEKSKEDCLADLSDAIQEFLDSKEKKKCKPPILDALNSLLGDGEIKGRSKNIPLSKLTEIAKNLMIPENDLPLFLR